MTKTWFGLGISVLLFGLLCCCGFVLYKNYGQGKNRLLMLLVHGIAIPHI
jgi:hypothetical protein